MVLERINNPEDLKKISISEMKTLATEIRECIIKKVNAK